IDSKPYHADFDFITWEYSSIRNYLNSEYYNTFNADEQSRIVETMVINSDNPDRGTAGGNNTTDKIFLLSIDEVNSYFSDKNSRIAYNANGRVSWWWLRSPGFGSSQAAYVTSNGGVRLDDVSTYNSYSVNNDDGGVRPALWLNL
ncbi:MAG: DUF6273 domain-containing protein, partial [Oscillospiraceae bacterium]|nr:DUF6273 domain-containing protein [Oscillospiraceae bacterium]